MADAAGRRCDRSARPRRDTDPTAAELVLSLGGDGTMLRSVQLLGGAPVPVIGVNVGLLGYLTEVEPHAMTDALERFEAGPGPGAGDWSIERRMMVDVDVRRADGRADATARALNEGVLEEVGTRSHRADDGAHRRCGLHVLRC
ncbi:MAG: NAD(+)/NADH kinase [Ilumatobacteraceae bacterium]